MKTPPLMRARCATTLLPLIILHLLTAAPARAATHHRSSFPRKFWTFEAGGSIAMETTVRPPAGVKDVVRERRLVWRDLEHKEPPLSNSPTRLSQTLVPERRKRGRRHALFGSRGHMHGQLMRVGCVLGTCQVQNLSYRLYRLVGQRKRERSSPVNPRSPHSYG
ncbi:hypothetical protein PHYPO_G00218290 [Pangasianodon hypophthalmus]|uniref:Uncharacterized protein n=1 Tax=Pangasianodon hypophthalmus TaxID=310915 RepID=A0A5N5P8F5_PANHP|nr:hypothetical protein PHYPO_G00218290 [Pangasianodon hypophthalmus]